MATARPPGAAASGRGRPRLPALTAVRPGPGVRARPGSALLPSARHAVRVGPEGRRARQGVPRWVRSGVRPGPESAHGRSRLRRPGVALAACVMGAGLLAACSSSSTSSSTTAAPSGKVLLVGTFHGHAGQYTSIQSAVDAAKPGDWILVAPGDYHETADSTQPTDPAHGDNAGVMISTPDLHLRGMNRSGVVVDGTKPGAPQCSANPADQTYGAVGSDGKTVGRNGIVVWKANDVSRRQPDGLQLPGRHRRLGQRDLVERRRRQRQDRPARLHGQLPDRHVDVLRRRGHGRPVRDLLLRRRRPGHAGTRSTPATSTTRASTSAPASRCAT